MRNYLIVFLVVVSLVSGYSQAERVLFILDASGSMWQKIDNKFKKNIATDVLSKVLNDIDDEVEFGLMAYGHNQEGDCDDIELLFPISTHETQDVINSIRDIDPKGRTPLARSSEKAIDIVKQSGLATSIILITDGLETCDGDLCQVVQKAKNDDIDFRMHIVGFGLSNNDRTTLKCAAEAGEGLYLDANSETELSFAIEQSTAMTTDVPPGVLTVKCVRNKELVDCAINVFKPGLSNPIAGVRTYSSKETNPATFNLPLGSFNVKAEMVDQQGIVAQTVEGVEISKGENETLQFDFSSGKISVKVTANGALHDAGIKVLLPGEKKSVALGRSYAGTKSNPWIEEVSPGIYNVEVKSISIQGDEIIKSFENVVVSGSKTTSLVHDYQFGALIVGAKCGENLCDALVYIKSVNSGKTVDQGRTYAHAKSNPKRFILSPGLYQIDVKPVKNQSNSQQSFKIEVKKGDELTKQITW